VRKVNDWDLSSVALSVGRTVDLMDVKMAFRLVDKMVLLMVGRKEFLEVDK
jgi:hypothetical protein